MTQQTKQPNLYVGIDPDMVKSGLAVWDGTQLTELLAFDFWTTVQWLLDNRADIKMIKIEGGWLNKTNWHTTPKQGVQGLAEIGRRVGMNHQTGLLLTEFLERFNFPFQVVKPLKNNWWADDKMKQFNRVTGWTGLSNPEKRDAAFLVFGIK